MAEHSTIEWTDATWNPVTGCSVVSPGCTNCYAMKLAGGRLQHLPSRAGLTTPSKAGPVWNGQVRFNAEWLDQPLRWKRPRRIFVCAHGDLFADGVEDAWIDQVFAVMALAPQHTFQVLTKRPERLVEYLATPGTTEKRRRFDAINAAAQALRPGSPLLANLWFMRHIQLGFSAEDQQRFDQRWAAFKAATSFGPKFVSIEPMLGPIDLHFQQEVCELCEGSGVLTRWPKGECHVCGGKGKVWINGEPDRRAFFKLDWVIVGGESGHGARPMHPDWARQIRDACTEAGVPFFFKQWGLWLAEGQAATRRPSKISIYERRWVAPDGDGRYTPDAAAVYPVGKSIAGRTLDGQLHNGMPQ